MAMVRGQCRHCLRVDVLKRGICLKCKSRTESMEDLIIKCHDLQAKLDHQKYLNRLLEFQLRRATIKLNRVKKHP